MDRPAAETEGWPSPRPPVRRGPAGLLVAAGSVLLVAVLALAGVVKAERANADDPPAVDPMAAAVSSLLQATGALVAALDQPAQDVATPADQAAAAAAAAATAPAVDSIALPTDSGEGMRVVYAVSAQRVWLVASDGTVERTYRVSGRLDRPQPGAYEVYSRSRNTTSYTGAETMEYMVRFAHGERAAIGFHDIPVDQAGNEVQTVEQLGQPLSAGCIRQALVDAVALWDFAPVGTKVIVVA